MKKVINLAVEVGTKQRHHRLEMVFQNHAISKEDLARLIVQVLTAPGQREHDYLDVTKGRFVLSGVAYRYSYNGK